MLSFLKWFIMSKKKQPLLFCNFKLVLLLKNPLHWFLARFSYQVRLWEAFTGLDSKVKNLLTSLRAVTELQNPAIRERHWHQLMAATGVRFIMDKVSALFLIYCMYVCDTLLVPVCTVCTLAESFLTWRFFPRNSWTQCSSCQFFLHKSLFYLFLFLNLDFSVLELYKTHLTEHFFHNSTVLVDCKSLVWETFLISAVRRLTVWLWLGIL